MKYLRLSILTLFAIALASLTSYNAFAALSVPVKLVNGNRDGRVYNISGTNSGCLSYPDNYSYAQNSCSDVTVLATSIPVQFAQGATFYSNNIVDIPLYFTLNSNNNALDAWLRNLTLDSNSNSRWSLIDVDYQMLSTSSGLAHIYIKAYVTNTDYSVTLTSNNNFILGLQPNEVIGIGNINVWEIVDTSVDTGSIVNSIQSQSSTLNSIDNGIKSLQDSMDGVADQEERVADVAEDEYNKTLDDEAQASSDANGFSFNFTLPNPLSLFNISGSGGCYYTPTIDSWLHLEGDWKSPHCPIIPDSVRQPLTPVVSALISLATLLVIIRWVSGSAVDVAGDIGSLQSKGDKK